ncbi:MAG: hypothetical protein J0H79_13940 [Alphaproteobacteria bacterium]|nr:hypothetical protein [Alphaproteobacteria bacterium]
MAITFPRTSMMEKMYVKSASFFPIYLQSFSGTQAGQIIVKDLGPELWSCKIESDDILHAKALKAQASINSLRGSLDTFYVWNPIAAGPQADLDGAVLGASLVRIKSLNANNRALSLTGLPNGYQLTEGDFLAFDYGTGPSRALHQVLEDTTANSSGYTVEFEVFPNIRPGAALLTTVTLIKPAAVMRMVPGSVSIASSDVLRSRISFEAIQVL